MKERQHNMLDELKGVAMLMVIFTHNSWSNNDRRAMGFPFWIDMAVPVFMMITGYLNAKSASRQNQLTIKDGFEIKGILKKLIRLYLRFLFACFLMFAVDYLRGTGYEPKVYLSVLFLGKAEYGGYYTFMLIQLIVLFPVLYQVVRRKPLYGLLFLFLLNIGYEYAKVPLLMSAAVYRVCVIRLIFSITVGIFIAVYDKNIPITTWGLACIVGAYINYVNYYHDLGIAGIDRWITKSWPSALYVMPVIYMAVKNGTKRPCHFKWIGIIGSKSYHIFLAQMVYFNSFKDFIYPLIDSSRLTHYPGLYLKLVINFAITIPAGLLFAKVAEPIEAKLIKKVTEGINYKSVQE